MAKMRVCDLAKECGMTSKEMLGYLKEMKIPAKVATSSLEDAFVAMARQKLKPILESRAAEIERQKKEAAEEEARLKKEAEEKAQKEREEAERRREKERKEEQTRAKAAADAAARAEAEAKAAKAAEEEKKKKERKIDNAPKASPSFAGLLSQIAQQEELLKAEREKAAARKAAEASAAKPSRTGSRKQDLRQKSASRHESRGSQAALEAQGLSRTPKEAGSRREKSAGDHYSQMAREAEKFNRESILSKARAAVEEANRESGGRRKKRKERRQQQAEEAARERAVAEAIQNDQDLSELDTVKVPQGSTVAELSELLGVAANEIVKRLFLLGSPLTMTQSMSDDLIELVADDLGRSVKVMSKEEENSFSFYDDPASLVPRPPVVTVMGHVDHGKTSLLDAIRHTGVAEGEAGGITQKIGASQVSIGDRTITFVDTPGHETFTAMRARGAKVTDIVVLVVAADDGVMPQTIESINHAKAAEVPLVVAVNKCDKPDANPDRVRNELAERGVIPEEWGGQTMFVNVSAKKRIGIDDLLETILLQADVLELKANPNTFASGYVLEAKLDRGRGSVASVLVNRGTLHVGDTLVAGLAYGRVRAMLDPRGKNVSEVKPSEAVEILGLSSVPAAGDEFRVFTDEREARNLAESRALKARIEEQSRKEHISLDTIFGKMQEGELKELNLVIKADVQGSIEALVDSLSKMDQSEVRLNVIHSAVGAVTETDVTLAAASDAIIIGFGVRPEAKAKAEAERQGIEIRCYSVIYQAIEDIDAARIGMLKPTEEEHQTGTAEVRDTFKVPKVGIAAGCMVLTGEISRDDSVRLLRDNVVVYEGSLVAVRRFKDDVKSVKAGYECGLSLTNFQDIHVGDVIEAYKIVEVARTE